MLGATHAKTEPLGCGLAGGNDDFGNVAGGTDAGGFGTFVYGRQLMALDVTTPGWNASVATN